MLVQPFFLEKFPDFRAIKPVPVRFRENLLSQVRLILQTLLQDIILPGSFKIVLIPQESNTVFRELYSKTSLIKHLSHLGHVQVPLPGQLMRVLHALGNILLLHLKKLGFHC